MTRFWRVRRKVLSGFLISLAAFLGLCVVQFSLRFGNSLLVVLKIPFSLLLPSMWTCPHDGTVLAINILITLIPVTGVIFALVQPRNGNIVAVAHISLVLYWMCAWFWINPS